MIRAFSTAGRAASVVPPRPSVTRPSQRAPVTVRRCRAPRLLPWRPTSRNGSSISRACRHSNSLGAGSDVRAFLAPGVPADLARAALRRAWSVDPVIRDFIGLSENAWDFNAPGGVPGFGTVTAEEVRRLLAHAIGEPEATDPLRPPAADGASQEQTEQDRLPAAEGAEPNEPTPYDRVDDVAAQQKSGEREHDPISPRRRHGSALPE